MAIADKAWSAFNARRGWHAGCTKLSAVRLPCPASPAPPLVADSSRLSAAPCGGVLVLTQHLVLFYRQGQQTGVVLHPSALPPRAPPPQLNLFDARAMQAAGGPGPAAALYARDHATDVFPVSACRSGWPDWCVQRVGACQLYTPAAGSGRRGIRAQGNQPGSGDAVVHDLPGCSVSCGQLRLAAPLGRRADSSAALTRQSLACMRATRVRVLCCRRRCRWLFSFAMPAVQKS